MPADDPSTIRVRDLRYRYPGTDRDVLRIPFLDIRGRGMIAITGPSGAGKSTLIELLAGTLRGDYSGSVEVLGEEWSQLRRDADRQRHLRRIGLIPQDYGLLADRSVAELLAQDLRDSGVDRDEQTERTTRALADVSLTGFEDRHVGGLSGGQRQRVAIARMLARDVDLVVADEPTANLDPALTQETMALFRRLAERTPVVIITHDPSVAAECDQTIVLQSAVADPQLDPMSSATPQGRPRRRLWPATAMLVTAVVIAAVVSLTLFRHQTAARAASHTNTTSAPTNARRFPGSTTRAHPAVSPVPTTSTPTIKPIAARTSQLVFGPWTEAGTLSRGVTVSARATGYCWVESLVVIGAYRCSAGNHIYDPCFAPALNSTEVACSYAPWSPVTLMMLSRSLPALTDNAAPTSSAPWAIELANGQRCVRTQGTIGEIGGVSMVYGCGSDNSEAGYVATGTEPWTVEFDKEGKAAVLSSEMVTVAWY